MDEKTKENVKKDAKIAGHGLADVANVAGHIIAGTAKGAADGIESVASHHRDKDDEKPDSKHD